MKLRLAVLLLVSSAAVGLAADTPCLNPNGVEVAWWIIYKLPAKYEQGLMGTEYYYYDSAGTEKTPDQDESINDPNSAFRRTINSANMAVQDSVVIYNEEYPNYNPNDAADTQSGASYAHSKGLFSIQGNDKGFWISHSFPDFAHITKTKTIRSDVGYSQLQKAQHAFCLTLDSADKVKTVLNHLRVLKVKKRVHNFQNVQNGVSLPKCGLEKYMTPAPGILDENFDECDDSQLILVNKANAIRAIINPGQSSHDHQMLLKQQFAVGMTLWSKSYRSGGENGESMEIWEEIANREDTKMYVQTYHNQDNFADTAKVFRQADHKSGDDYTWTAGNDHAKWGFSEDADQLACFGDLNRHNGQKNRGGGVLCLKNAVLHGKMKQFYDENPAMQDRFKQRNQSFLG